MKPQLWNKNMVRILVWLDPLHHHRRTSLPMVNSRRQLHYCKNSKELLRKAVDFSQGKATVPRGFLPVYVGPDLRRFLILAKYLSTPDFRALMERAEEEFGFQQDGGLRIPCEEDDFKEMQGKKEEGVQDQKKGQLMVNH